MALEDQILVDLHRAAALASRPGIAVPSRDLEATSREIGRQGTKDAVSRLVRAGRVQSVRRDLVILPDATGRMTVGLPELIKVVVPSHHLITGGRALEEHRLTNQHFFSIVVLVPNPVSGFIYRGQKAVFLTTPEERIWGWQEDGPHFAVPERAIVDAVSHPRYGVSLPMATEALTSASLRDPDFLERLASAARRYGSTATARRLGLLVTRLFGRDAAEPFHELIGESRTPVPLRPGGQSKGEFDHEWRVILNASVSSAEVIV
ncbi:MAG TPA: hypothetical protein VG244_13190 [Acidimicrobiales bacterium]|jgi:predicted transcriptional regulator of viral defense system|nr:hypothetical protein [Acidimicrobiales bacterium]